MQPKLFTKLKHTYNYTDYIVVGIDRESINDTEAGCRYSERIARFCVMHLKPTISCLRHSLDMVECEGAEIFEVCLSAFATGSKVLMVVNDSLVALGSSDFVYMLENDIIEIGRGNLKEEDYLFEGDGEVDTYNFIASAPPTIVDIRCKNIHKDITLIDIANWGIRDLEDIYNNLDDNDKKMVPNWCELGVSVDKSDTCCVLMSRYLQEIYRVTKHHGLGGTAPTYAAQAMRAYRKNHYNGEITLHREEDVADLEERCYTGGRGEARYQGHYHGEVYLLDIQSLYPAQSLEADYPVALQEKAYGLDVETAKQWCEESIVFAHCLVETEQPQFPVRRNGRTFFPIGKYNAFLSGAEFKAAINQGNIRGIRFAARYQKAKVLKDFSYRMLELRSEAKENGKRLQELIIKLVTNGLWGKFGQIAHRWIVDTTKQPHASYGGFVDYNLETGEETQYRIINGIVSRLVRSYWNDNTFCAISSIANATSRDLLWRYMQFAGISNVLYCATDGLIVTREGRDRLQAFIAESPVDYGKFKESEHGNGCFISSYGVYKIGNKTAYIGIPKTGKERVIGFWNDCTTIQRRIDVPYVSIRRDGTVRSREHLGRCEGETGKMQGSFICPSVLDDLHLEQAKYDRRSHQGRFHFAEWS